MKLKTDKKLKFGRLKNCGIRNEEYEFFRNFGLGNFMRNITNYRTKK